MVCIISIEVYMLKMPSSLLAKEAVKVTDGLRNKK